MRYAMIATMEACGNFLWQIVIQTLIKLFVHVVMHVVLQKRMKVMLFVAHHSCHQEHLFSKPFNLKENYFVRKSLDLKSSGFGPDRRTEPFAFAFLLANLAIADTYEFSNRGYLRVVRNQGKGEPKIDLIGSE